MLARFARRFFRFDGIFGFFQWHVFWMLLTGWSTFGHYFGARKKATPSWVAAHSTQSPAQSAIIIVPLFFLFAVKKNTGFWTTPERYHHYGLNCHAYPCFYKTLFISSAKENHRVEHYTNFLHYQFISQENYSNVG